MSNPLRVWEHPNGSKRILRRDGKMFATTPRGLVKISEAELTPEWEAAYLYQLDTVMGQQGFYVRDNK